MSHDQELSVLNETPEEEQLQIELIEALRAIGKIGPGKGSPITEPEYLQFIEKLKTALRSKKE